MIGLFGRHAQIWMMAMLTHDNIRGVCQGALSCFVLGFFILPYSFFHSLFSSLGRLGLLSYFHARLLLSVYLLVLIAWLPRELRVVKLLYKGCSPVFKLLLYASPIFSTMGFAGLMCEPFHSGPLGSHVYAALAMVFLVLWVYCLLDYRSKSKNIRGFKDPGESYNPDKRALEKLKTCR